MQLIKIQTIAKTLLEFTTFKNAAVRVVKCSIAHLTDHHGWNGIIMVGTGKLFRVLWYKFHDIWFHSQYFHFWFRPFAGKSVLYSKTTGKRSHLVHFGYCHYVIKYFMRDTMDYPCLRVFRSRDIRIGKHSPGFSVFRTRVHVCSYAEPCRVPIQSTVAVSYTHLTLPTKDCV